MNVGIILGLAVLGLLVIEPLLEDWLYLQIQRGQLFLSTALMKLRMEYEIWQIDRNKTKYLDWAKQYIAEQQNNTTKSTEE